MTQPTGPASTARQPQYHYTYIRMVVKCDYPRRSATISQSHQVRRNTPTRILVWRISAHGEINDHVSRLCNVNPIGPVFLANDHSDLAEEDQCPGDFADQFSVGLDRGRLDHCPGVGRFDGARGSDCFRAGGLHCTAEPPFLSEVWKARSGRSAVLPLLWSSALVIATLASVLRTPSE